MPIAGVSHLGLCVTDLDASLRFYCDVLGFEVLTSIQSSSPQVAKLVELEEIDMSLKVIQLDPLRLELIQFSTPSPIGGGHGPFNRVGYTHLSLKVLDFDAELERVRRAGAHLLESTIGKIGSNSRFAFVLDPDGNRVELLAPFDDEAARKPWDFSSSG